MSETAEAAQLLQVFTGMLSQAGSIMFKVSEDGAKLVKAMYQVIHERKPKGEISLDTLRRHETRIAVYKFDRENLETVKAELKKQGFGYAVVEREEEAEVYFGAENLPQVNAFIASSKIGKIVSEADASDYIMSGEVSLDVLVNQDGQDFQIVDLSNNELTSFTERMDAWKFKFAFMPDLNLKDEKTQVAIPNSQVARMNSFLVKYKGVYHAGFISNEEYSETADPELIERKVAEYEKNAVHNIPPDKVVIQTVIGENGKVQQATVIVPKECLIEDQPDDPVAGLCIGNRKMCLISREDIRLSGGKAELTIDPEKEYKVLDLQKTEESLTGTLLISRIQEETKRAREAAERMKKEAAEKVKKATEEASKTVSDTVGRLKR